MKTSNTGFFRGVFAAASALSAVATAAVGTYLLTKGIKDNCFGEGTSTCTALEAANPLVSPILTVAFTLAAFVSGCCCRTNTTSPEAKPLLNDATAKGNTAGTSTRDLEAQEAPTAPPVANLYPAAY